MATSQLSLFASRTRQGSPELASPAVSTRSAACKWCGEARSPDAKAGVYCSPKCRIAASMARRSAQRLTEREREEYAKAGIPMMPVVQGAHRTKVQMLGYTIMLVPLSLLPWLSGTQGAIYAGAALLLGARLLWYCVKLLREPERSGLPWKMYRFSLGYLALLFVAMGVDRAFPVGHLRPAVEVTLIEVPVAPVKMP